MVHEPSGGCDDVSSIFMRGDVDREYYFGIIDYLQEFNKEKRLESLIKSRFSTKIW